LLRRSVLLSRRVALLIAMGCVAISGYAQSSQKESSDRAQISAGPYRVAGTVVNAKAGTPLAFCHVILTDVRNRQNVQSVMTSDDGRFAFHVPGGKYALEGERPGFITALYNQHEQFSSAIVAGADLATEDLVLRLAPNAALTGKVLDEVGEPVRNAQIVVYREEHFEGVSRIVPCRGSSTDDQGHYEATPLDEGTYFVSAKASPWYAIHPTSSGGASRFSQVDSSLDVAYPITYYGDVTDADGANPIPVRGGDHLEADIHLSPVPALHLMVHLSENVGPHAAIFPRLQKPAFDGPDQVESASIESVGPGVYELTGVAAGHYTVRMPDSSGQLQEPTAIDLNGSGELNLSSSKHTSKIKVAARIEGATSLPSQLRIILSNSQGKTSQAEVDTKGVADFSDVIAGNYDVIAESPTQTYSVVRIASESESISGHSVNVPPNATLTIALSLVGGSVTVEGIANRSGKVASGAMIVLVPKNPQADRDHFRREESSLDGSFELKNVIPGSYTIIAIEDGWDLDWGVPGALARYLQHGQPIEVGSGSRTAMHLADAVEVQTK
jgi:Carboxypeptidase regulatory-like domain